MKPGWCVHRFQRQERNATYIKASITPGVTVYQRIPQATAEMTSEGL